MSVQEFSKILKYFKFHNSETLAVNTCAALQNLETQLILFVCLAPLFSTWLCLLKSILKILKCGSAVCPFQVKSGSYFCCCYISLSFLHIATCNFLISVHQLHPRLCFVQLPAHTRPLFKPTLFFLSGTASSAEKPLSSVSFSHPGVAAAVLAVIDTCEILFLGAKN